MKNRLPYLLAFTALSSLSADTMDDYFSELETSSLKTESSTGGIFEQITSNLDVTLSLRAYSYRSSDTIAQDTSDDFFESKLDYSTTFKTGNLQFTTTGYLESGIPDNQWNGVTNLVQDNGEDRNYLELNEFYFNYSTDTLDFTVGRKILENGISYLYSPVDIHGNYDLTDPLDIQKLGVYQVRVDYHINDWILTAAILPINENARTANLDSRWVLGSIDYSFKKNMQLQDENIDTAYSPIRSVEENVGKDLQDIAYFIRAEGKLANVDLFVSAYYGYNPHYVYEMSGGQSYIDFFINEEAPLPELTLTKKHSRSVNLSSGFSTTAGLTEFHAENVFNWAVEEDEDSYMSYVIGMTHEFEGVAQWLGIDSIFGIVEYAGEIMIDSVNEPDIVSGNEHVNAIVKMGTEMVQENLKMNQFEENIEIFNGITSSDKAVFLAAFEKLNKSFSEFEASISNYLFENINNENELDAFYNALENDLNYTNGYYNSSYTSRIGQNSILLKLIAGIDSNDKIDMGYAHDMDRNSFLVNAYYTHIFPKEIIVNLGIEFFGGDENSYYGFWKDNDRYVLNISKAF